MASSRPRVGRLLGVLAGAIVLAWLATALLARRDAALRRERAGAARSAAFASEPGTRSSRTPEPEPREAVESASSSAGGEGTKQSALDDAGGDLGTLEAALPDDVVTRVAPTPRWIVKIASGENGFDGRLREGDGFGAAVTEIDDLDGDGNRELAVAAPGDDEAGEDAGAVWILFFDDDERVRAAQKLTSITAGLPAGGVRAYALGHSLCTVPDHDGDGRHALAVAQSLVPARDDDPAAEVWFLTLDREGGVAERRLLDAALLYPYPSWRKTARVTIAAGSSASPDGRRDFTIALPNGPSTCGDPEDLGFAHQYTIAPDGRLEYVLGFGAPCTGLDDGTSRTEVGRAMLLVDLACGGRSLDTLYGFLDDDGSGAVLRLGACLPPRFARGKDPADPAFGSSLAWLDDRDGDGSAEIAIGWKQRSDDATESPGGVWIVSFDARSTHPDEENVIAWELLLPDSHGLAEHASPGDRFGASLATVSDRDGDRRVELAIGAPGDDAGGADAGALWLYGPGRGVER